MNIKHNNTEEEYREAAKNSISIAGMCKYLGRNPCGAGYYIMKKKIKEYNIDIRHFQGRGWNKGGKFNPMEFKKIPMEQILVEDSNYSSNDLRKRLLKEGYKEYKCEKCGRSEWEGEPIPLELHHINGNHTDHRLENLLILCPNCHAQTDNYCSKRIKVKKEKKSKDEIKKISSSKEVKIRSKKLPNDEVMFKYIKDGLSNVKIAELFNVSETAVRKWKKKHLDNGSVPELV